MADYKTLTRRTTLTTSAKYRVNNEIKNIAQVRLIDDDGTQLGTFSLFDAFQMAKTKGLDLVEIAKDARPAVCRLMDYGKYQFDQKKKEKEEKRAQKISAVETKEIQFSAVIQDNDLLIKIKNIQRLLDEGNRVIVKAKFIGRIAQHQEIGKELFEKVLSALPEVIVERPPVYEMRNLMMTLINKK